jgi:solute carrier family 25 (mitochondrial iron transporter), member 28/37
MSSKIEKLSRDSTIQLTAGAFSGVFSDILTHPFDLLTTRAQATIGKHEKLIPQIKNIVQHEGYRSLWKGFSSVFVASVPGHAAYFFG